MSRQDVLRALGAPEYVVNEPLPPGPGGFQMESFGAFPCRCNECILSSMVEEMGLDIDDDDVGEQGQAGSSALPRQNTWASASTSASAAETGASGRRAGDSGSRIEEVKEEEGGMEGTLQCAACRLKDKGKVRLCTGCRKVAYCSRECQVKDWKSHKSTCKPKKPEAESAKAASTATSTSVPASASTDASNEPVVVTPPIGKCARCGWDKNFDLEFCEACRRAKYCSQDCEDADKETHRAFCEMERKRIAQEKTENAAAAEREVHVPPEAMDHCSQCGSEKQDSWKLYFWKTHKAFCGETDRIEISSFYPLLACLIDISHDHILKPIHKAFTLTVMNDPTPGSNPMEFSDGWEAVPVLLGLPTRRAQRPVPIDRSWWPAAANSAILGKLAARIRREGFFLPILTAVSLALLSEMYTTTSAADSSQHRLRLRYRTMPISDFGICAGSARVVNQDKLGYLDMRTLSELHGQDPNDHYWLYFRTARGEEVLLDCAMFTFNLNMLIFARPYGITSDTFVPAFFQEREMRQNAPALHMERKRVSMLRSSQMQQVAANSARGFVPEDEDRVAAFMESLAGRAVTGVERELAMALAKDHTRVIREALQEEQWKQYPEDVQIAIAGDPGELDNWEERCDVWWDNLQKDKRKKKQKARKGRASGV
ncbi:hypothetical protein EVG20_g385 [Dentipellis fragilis]|uniref:MYND-type domain-containing protein n=1 Tax=Dentipellis fragilis TaxID=205917 RepID=A0A4Y9ZCZ6_9AGAM|nr:hypothetical protein EVG20_g385 [Dentipellis fragilis]